MNKEDSGGEGKSQDASTPGSVPAKDSNAELYENRGPKKIIRVVTVMAYLFSVSFVGILLSAYYIFLWEPPNPRLIQRERLRMDPQMQLLIAPSSEETDLMKKDSSFLLQNKINPVRKPLRMMHDDDSVVDPRKKINIEKKRRLNAVLLKLRHSLVGTLRAQRRNSSQEITNSSGYNNSFVGKVLNSTMENTISRYGNVSEETHSDNVDLSVEFADLVNTPIVASTSSTSKFMTIPGTEMSQRHFDKDSVNPIIEEKNHKKNPVGSYFIHRFSNAMTNSNITSGSDRRNFGDNDSSKMTQEFLKTDRKESMEQNEANDRRLINNDRKSDSDIQTSIILEERVNGSIGNSQENYSSDESSPNDQIVQIAIDKVSIVPSSRDSGFTDDPGFHQMTPDNPSVVKSRPRITERRNSEETQIERMTARSTTIDNKQLEQIDLSTIQRQKNFPEIITEIVDIEETSVELTSVSTTRDYHNFTSITSEDDESVT